MVDALCTVLFFNINTIVLNYVFFSTWRDIEVATTAKHPSKSVVDDRTSLAVVQLMNVVRLLGSHNGDFLMEFEQVIAM